jgi:hypothetical protein
MPSQLFFSCAHANPLIHVHALAEAFVLRRNVRITVSLGCVDMYRNQIVTDANCTNATQFLAL